MASSAAQIAQDMGSWNFAATNRRFSRNGNCQRKDISQNGSESRNAGERKGSRVPLPTTIRAEPKRVLSAVRADAVTPKYIRIRDWLMDRILSLDLKRGEQLPSEHDLVRQFGASRVTVRQALEALRAEGIVESQHGRGWFLRRVRAVQNLGRLQGFGEMLAPMGVRVRSKVLEVSECTAPDAIADAFAMVRGTNVVRIARLRLAGGRVMSYDLSYFPSDIGRRLSQEDLARQDVFVLFERALGIRLGFADVTIEVAPADDDPAARLNVATGTPIFKLTRLTHDSRGVPIDFEYVYGLPEAHQFTVRVPRR
jgi:GntR family transcriptional regulator